MKKIRIRNVVFSFLVILAVSAAADAEECLYCPNDRPELEVGKIWVQFTKDSKPISCYLPPLPNALIGNETSASFAQIAPDATGVTIWVGKKLELSFALEILKEGQMANEGYGGSAKVVVFFHGDPDKEALLAITIVEEESKES